MQNQRIRIRLKAFDYKLIDQSAMEIELIAPIAMDEGLRFAIREGGRTVGAGVVAKIIK